MNKSSLDKDFLAELLEGDKEFAAELFEIYSESSNQCLDELKQLFETNQKEKSARAFHTLKGTSSSVGLVNLQKMAHELELAAKAGDYHVCEARMPELRDAIGQAGSILQAYLEEL